MGKKIVCYDHLLTHPSPMCIVKLWQLPLKCIADLFFFALHKAYRCSFMVKKIKCISMVFGKGHLLKFVQYWFWKTIRCSAKTQNTPLHLLHVYTFKQHVAALTQLSKTLRCAEFALKRQRVLEWNSNTLLGFCNDSTMIPYSP